LLTICVEERQEPEPDCQLQTSFGCCDLQDLFHSGLEVLTTQFEVLPLSESLRQDLHQYEIKPLTTTQELDHYDRLLIFTDGSSIPAMRRMMPERADELGHPDTWAFVVVAESFETMQHSKLTILGWTAQPVRYDPNESSYAGITRTGSDMAERSALIGVAMWRLSLNHGITTVFCPDSLQGGGQAAGNLGTAAPDESYKLLRSLFQALELALPGA